MISFLVFVVACFGLSWVIGWSKISYPIRERLSDAGSVWVLGLLECPGCLGWHTGWLAIAFGIAPPVFSRDVLGAMLCAFFIAGSNLVLARLCGLTED